MVEVQAMECDSRHPHEKLLGGRHSLQQVTILFLFAGTWETAGAH